MSKRFERIILILVIILTGIYAFKSYKFKNDNILFRLQGLIFRENSVIVETHDLDINKVKIVSIEDNKVVFATGKETSKIKNQYGGDNFEIFYNNKKIGQAGIYKKNWWHIHNYYFELLKHNSKYIFRFRVVGPDQNSLEYYCYEFDTKKKKSTMVFYDTDGKTGQVSYEYFDKNGNIVADETWLDSILTNMNTYKNGKFNRNYSASIGKENIKHKLSRLNQTESLVYVYQTVSNNKTKDEIIEIKIE